MPVCGILAVITISSLGTMGPLIDLQDRLCSGFQIKRARSASHRLRRRITMEEGRNKLIEEIGELALQYDMKHSG